MNNTVYLRPDAETDIAEAAVWYRKHSKKLLSSLEKITNDPCIYPVVHRHIRRVLVNRFPFGIYYQIEGYSISVIAVMHGSRHPKRWRQRI
ncbi:MAG: type II toxin-antitoxin system RelE/ParE family toxin [Deltaproteobacteria bacterium]|nr:type II toxin-antitoxin system RelE/ParE family toxin [Deltaproteobacteria bacterium]